MKISSTLFLIGIYASLVTISLGCSYNVLVAMSSAGHITLTNGLQPVIGFYLDELATPSQMLIKAGFNLTFANPKGNRPPMDPRSNNTKYFNTTEEYFEALEFVESTQYNLNNPIPYDEIDEIELEKYDAIFIPGGHAPLVDLWNNKYLGQILANFHDNYKPTGAICHGPVALVSTNLTGTPWTYDGYNLTVFSTYADQVIEKMWGGDLFFYPEDILRNTGAIVTEATPGSPHIIQYKEVITGQNPYSAQIFGEQFVSNIINYCNSK